MERVKLRRLARRWLSQATETRTILKGPFGQSERTTAGIEKSCGDGY